MLPSVFLALLLAGAEARAEPCRFSSRPTVAVNDGRLLQSWEQDDSPRWTSDVFPVLPAYRRFVEYARARVDVSEPRRYVSAPALPTAADRRNAELVLNGGIGELKPINCLEAVLLDAQARRLPMETRPTEFLAFVLRRVDGKKSRLKVWFYTVDQPGIGRLGPLKDAAEKDVAAGWRPWVNLHNHNFAFDRTPLVPGVPWPSAIDVQLMKGLSIGGFLFEITAVTNGFTTARLRPEHLQLLRGADQD